MWWYKFYPQTEWGILVTCITCIIHLVMNFFQFQVLLVGLHLGSWDVNATSISCKFESPWSLHLHSCNIDAVSCVNGTWKRLPACWLITFLTFHARCYAKTSMDSIWCQEQVGCIYIWNHKLLPNFVQTLMMNTECAQCWFFHCYIIEYLAFWLSCCEK